MIIPVRLGEASYDIVIRRGAIDDAAKVILNGERRVCIVTDSGVPRSHVSRLLSILGNKAILHVLPKGEENKNFDNLRDLLCRMLEAGFTRFDAVVALGGGVVGDLAGFAAATYMRGIDFYNIPTTLLSQVDSSVGGKTAVDLDGYKNMIGAFHQPRAVLIDPELLSTLPCRHVSNGLCEALKMGATSDASLFELFEGNAILTATDPAAPLGEVPEIIDLIIEKAISVKRDVVERDEREGGLRKVLNFGHTLGHAIETSSGLSLLHGECVALGIPPMCKSEELKQRISRALGNVGLPTDTEKYARNKAALLAALSHDKKSTSGGCISAILLNDIGDFEFLKLTPEELIERI